LAKKNQLTIIRYAAQGSRIIFAFFLLLLAKNQGDITNYGRLLNINAIYAMLTSVAIMPFINKLWEKYEFISVIKQLSKCFIIISILMFIIFYNFSSIYNLLIVIIGSYIFVFTNILIQFFQSQSKLFFKVPAIVLTINFFSVIIIMFANSFLELIIFYFLPYLIVLFFLPHFYKELNEKKVKEKCKLKDTYDFFKNLYGWSLVVSLCWPIAFFIIREIVSVRDIKIWENYEFTFRVFLSVLGLASAFIINYNLHDMKNKLYDVTKTLITKSLVPSYILSVLAFVFLFLYLINISVIDLVLFFMAYLIKIILLSLSYPLFGVFKIKPIAIIEILNSVLLVGLIYINISVAFSIFISTLISGFSIFYIWKKTIISKNKLFK
tara:strand:- start:5209 stop:6348 length:1140 start_codon:yes stop_codon:yes gene_type:complete